jgi:hypothetical protein
MSIPYRETGLNQRVTNIYISNNPGMMPSLAFQRQLAVVASGVTAYKDLTPVSLQLTPATAATEFPWLTGENDTDTGKTLTYADVYDVLYSLAKHTLVAQDAKDAIQEQIQALQEQLAT